MSAYWQRQRRRQAAVGPVDQRERAFQRQAELVRNRQPEARAARHAIARTAHELKSMSNTATAEDFDKQFLAWLENQNTRLLPRNN